MMVALTPEMLERHDPVKVLQDFMSLSLTLLAEHGQPATLAELHRVESHIEVPNRIESHVKIWQKIRDDSSLPEHARLAAEAVFRCDNAQRFIDAGRLRDALWEFNRVWELVANILIITDARSVESGLKAIGKLQKARDEKSSKKAQRVEWVWQKRNELVEANPRLRDNSRAATKLRETMLAECPELFIEPPSRKTILRYLTEKTNIST
jgi:hypothetical protein